MIKLLLTLATLLLVSFYTPPAYAQDIVSVNTPDGVILKSCIYHAKAARATVLLLHMLGRSQADYEPLVNTLLHNNFDVITTDFRGHGLSTQLASGASLTFHSFNNADWGKLVADSELILNTFSKSSYHLARPFAVVGASIGANCTAWLANSHPYVTTVVMLSPGLDYHGLKPLSEVQKFQHHALIIAGTGDTYAATSSTDLADANQPMVKLELKNTAAHGTNLFSTTGDITGEIVDWLKSNTAKK